MNGNLKENKIQNSGENRRHVNRDREQRRRVESRAPAIRVSQRETLDSTGVLQGFRVQVRSMTLQTCRGLTTPSDADTADDQLRAENITSIHIFLFIHFLLTTLESTPQYR